jgi:DNA-binding Lrp family transcriptional regulator
VTAGQGAVGLEQIRRELIADYWRGGMPTTEIARAVGIDEAAVCRVVEQIEGDGRCKGETGT